MDGGKSLPTYVTAVSCVIDVLLQFIGGDHFVFEKQTRTLRTRSLYKVFLFKLDKTQVACDVYSYSFHGWTKSAVV